MEEPGSTPTPPGQITSLLRQWKLGDKLAVDNLAPLIYPELHRLARRHLRSSRDAQLSPTELVHEAFLRLCGQEHPNWQHRAHFYYIAARVMRQVLVDFVREKQSQKRGGGAQTVSLETVRGISAGRAPSVVDIHEALKELELFDERKARVLELRYFVGLSAEEIAAMLGVSVITVARDVRAASAWLRSHLQQTDRPGE